MSMLNESDPFARLSRRQFLTATGAMAGAASLGLTISPEALAGTATQTLVQIFLRGGMDGLSLVPPIAGPDLGAYMDARDRTTLDINSSTLANRPLPLGASNFGLHPWCDGLHQLFNQGKLAIVQAAGHPAGTETRSHFDSQEQIELGTPGQQISQNGWLTRHLQSTPLLQNDAVFTSLVSSNSPPLSLGGYSDIATLGSTSNFRPTLSSSYAFTQQQMLQQLYSGSGGLDLAAQSTLDAVDLISSLNLGSYVPGGGATYPNNGVGDDLKLIAQLIREDIGIAVATLDLGGWDTHNGQNVLAGGYGTNVQALSDAITAFYTDLAANGRANNIALVVQSEFGRQVKENANFGTDHGLGNPMLVLGGRVQGGLYGDFPGLAINQRLNDSLRPTTDFRRVLASVVQGLVDNPNIDAVFPDPTFLAGFQPMGFV